MKNDVKVKAQGSSVTTKYEVAELMAAVMKIAERLEVLEKKTDLVIRQTSARPVEGRLHPKPVPAPYVPPQPFRQPAPPVRPNEVKPVQGPASVQQCQGQNQQRRERILHKAVCADCHKDCEIPFKPTGERPVYCKECFSRRKVGNSSKANSGDKQVSHLPEVPAVVNPPQRMVVVTKKGVGKVTVSEIVRPSSRDTSSKGKSHRPSKKPKR